jgi:1-acyl-sn-glycerol-3-phosphate acyltransferase
MFYQFIKIIARIAIRFYCRDIKINKKELLKNNGPLLLAANHPNSFLDAVILCTLFDKPVYSLARGDAFNGRLISKILYALKLLPVYRASEGVENLEENYATFEECIKIFKQNGIVLIFSEGRCENEWHLRPLKKGTARLAIAAWQQQIPLQILPIGINYNSFFLFGKNVHISMGEAFGDISQVKNFTGSGQLLNELTAAIQRQLQLLVYKIDKGDRQTRIIKLYHPISNFKKYALSIPAFFGWLIHSPLYFFVKRYIVKRASEDGHYDSIMTGALMFIYPFYLLLFAVLAYLFLGNYWWLLVFVLLPFFAWSYVQIKKQVE